jgi:tRNA(His) 5'-end guanylyltransferase
MSDTTSDIAVRFKRYEKVFSPSLPYRIPVIIRIDGRSFHTYTRKKYGKNYSIDFVFAMMGVARYGQDGMQGCHFAYCQSDEISFLLTDYTTIQTQPYFDYDLSKLVSITASRASVYLSRTEGINVEFDARAFSVPQDDVCNYFVWRQQDAIRNAIQMAGQEHFSQKQLHKKSCKQIVEMLRQKDIDFDKFPITRQRGFCIINREICQNIPEFNQDRGYVDKHVYVRQD